MIKSIKTKLSSLLGILRVLDEREERCEISQSDSGKTVKIDHEDRSYWAPVYGQISLNGRHKVVSSKESELVRAWLCKERKGMITGSYCPITFNSQSDSEKTHSVSMLEHAYAEKFCPHCENEDETHTTMLIETADGAVCIECGYEEPTENRDFQSLSYFSSLSKEENERSMEEVRDGWSMTDDFWSEKPVLRTGTGKSIDDEEFEKAPSLDMDKIFKDGEEKGMKVLTKELSKVLFKVLKRRGKFMKKHLVEERANNMAKKLFKVWSETLLEEDKNLLSLDNTIEGNEDVDDNKSHLENYSQDRFDELSSALKTVVRTEKSKDYSKFIKEVSKDLINSSYFSDKKYKGKSWFSVKFNAVKDDMDVEEQQYWMDLYSLGLDYRNVIDNEVGIFRDPKTNKLTSYAHYEGKTLVPGPYDKKLVDDIYIYRGVKLNKLGFKNLIGRGYKGWMKNIHHGVNKVRSIEEDLTGLPYGFETLKSAAANKKVAVFGELYIAIVGKTATIGNIKKSKVFGLKEIYGVKYIKKDFWISEEDKKEILTKSLNIFNEKKYKVVFLSDDVEREVNNYIS